MSEQDNANPESPAPKTRIDELQDLEPSLEVPKSDAERIRGGRAQQTFPNTSHPTAPGGVDYGGD